MRDWPSRTGERRNSPDDEGRNSTIVIAPPIEKRATTRRNGTHGGYLTTAIRVAGSMELTEPGRL
ncbi:hypothetical protein C5E44_08560 [Nocardia nova]|nr:hypothetical protein C5E44_08560 [Nocardia nova]